MEKISITRALAELKLLDSRINKEIEQGTFTDIYQNRADKVLFKGCTKEEYENRAKSCYDSISDLISRRDKIKKEILKSNSVTLVKISGIDYTVSEAIERKNSIKYDKKLLERMKQSLTVCKSEIDKNKVTLDQQIDNMMMQSLGTDKKVDEDAWIKIAKPFIEANEVRLFDPIGIEKKVEKLDKKIDEFLSEVDFVLSESNSKTEIKI